MDLTQMTPAEVDKLLFEALRPAQRIEATMAGLRKSARQYRKYGGRYAQRADEYDARATDLEPDLAEALEAAAPYDAEFSRRGGWVRYLLVSGGHLHKRGCSTLTPGRTLVGLLVDASGLTDSEVVAAYDYTACTHCFPDAPVEAARTPEQDGFCRHSGQPITDEQRAALEARWGSWYNLAVAPSVRCECGGYPSITKTDKVRKHKPGRPQL